MAIAAEALRRTTEGEITKLSSVEFDVTSVEEAVSRFGAHWAPDYRGYAENPVQTQANMHRKIDDIAALLRLKEDEVAHSKAFIDRCYGDWRSEDKIPGYESFVFMVPTRAERGNGFAPEFMPFIPLIDKLGPSAAQLLLVGLPPFIVDRYQPNSENKAGAMMFAPVFFDMKNDYTDPFEALGVMEENITDAVVFARDKLEAKSVGLGAILPGVTDFGRSIARRVDGINITTGHGGTVHLAVSTIDRAVKEGRIENLDGIAVAGLGAIGASFATVLRDRYPDVPMEICDLEESKVARTVKAMQELGLDTSGVFVAQSVEDMISNPRNTVTVSALVNAYMSPQGVDLRDRMILDDSQPTAFDPVAVAAGGGLLTWPIGTDKTPEGLITRTNFSYGDLGPAMDNENWGCELEAAVVGMPDGNPDMAVLGPVKPQKAIELGRYILANDIAEAAPLQSFGRHL